MWPAPRRTAPQGRRIWDEQAGYGGGRFQAGQSPAGGRSQGHGLRGGGILPQRGRGHRAVRRGEARPCDHGYHYEGDGRAGRRGDHPEKQPGRQDCDDLLPGLWRHLRAGQGHRHPGLCGKALSPGAAGAGVWRGAVVAGL